MDAARRLVLQASLERGLNSRADEHGLSSMGRVGWLLDQVENYVERWLGLTSVHAQTIAPFNDDLFSMIEIGADVISRELKEVESAPVIKSWQAFLEALAEVQTGSIEPQRLAESLAVVRSELDTWA